MNIFGIKKYFSDLPTRFTQPLLDAESDKKRFEYYLFSRML